MLRPRRLPPCRHGLLLIAQPPHHVGTPQVRARARVRARFRVRARARVRVSA